VKSARKRNCRDRWHQLRCVMCAGCALIAAASSQRTRLVQNDIRRRLGRCVDGPIMQATRAFPVARKRLSSQGQRVIRSARKRSGVSEILVKRHGGLPWLRPCCLEDPFLNVLRQTTFA